MAEDPVLAELMERLQTWKAVLVVGAGVTREIDLPLTKHLDFLIKRLTGEEPRSEQKRIEAFDRIATDQTMEAKFRKEFALVCHEHAGKQNLALNTLAALYHVDRIRHIVTTNWDDSIEQHYKAQFGRAIEKIATASAVTPTVKIRGIDTPKALWKLHGDVADPQGPWIYPNDPGRVFPGLVKEAAASTTMLITVGYGMADAGVMSGLIKPMSKTCPVYAVSRNPRPEYELVGAKHVPLDAGAFFAALSALLARLDHLKLRQSTFTPRGGLVDLLVGERIDDALVHAAVSNATQRWECSKLLRRTGRLHLRADHGAGKTCLAFQVAMQLFGDGTDVFEFVGDSDTTPPTAAEALAFLADYPRPWLLMVDDAQNLPRESKAAITEWARARAGPGRAVMYLTTKDDSSAGMDAILDAVTPFYVQWDDLKVEMRRFFEAPEHKKVVLEIRAGSQVKLPYDELLDLAFGKTVSTAWQAVYTLAGGEQFLRHHLEKLAEIAGQPGLEFFAALCGLYVATRERSVSLSQIVPTLEGSTVSEAARIANMILERGGRVYFSKTMGDYRPHHWHQAVIAFRALLGEGSTKLRSPGSLVSKIIRGLAPGEIDGARWVLFFAFEVDRTIFNRALDENASAVARLIEQTPPGGFYKAAFFLWYVGRMDPTRVLGIIDKMNFQAIAARIERSNGPDMAGVDDFLGAIPAVEILASNLVSKGVPLETALRGRHYYERSKEFVAVCGPSVARLVNSAGAKDHAYAALVIQGLDRLDGLVDPIRKQLDPEAIAREIRKGRLEDAQGSSVLLAVLDGYDRELGRKIRDSLHAMAFRAAELDAPSAALTDNALSFVIAKSMYEGTGLTGNAKQAAEEIERIDTALKGVSEEFADAVESAAKTGDLIVVAGAILRLLDSIANQYSTFSTLTDRKHLASKAQMAREMVAVAEGPLRARNAWVPLAFLFRAKAMIEYFEGHPDTAIATMKDAAAFAREAKLEGLARACEKQIEGIK